MSGPEGGETPSSRKDFVRDFSGNQIGNWGGGKAGDPSQRGKGYQIIKKKGTEKGGGGGRNRGES